MPKPDRELLEDSTHAGRVAKGASFARHALDALDEGGRVVITVVSKSGARYDFDFADAAAARALVDREYQDRIVSVRAAVAKAGRG